MRADLAQVGAFFGATGRRTVLHEVVVGLEGNEMRTQIDNVEATLQR